MHSTRLRSDTVFLRRECVHCAMCLERYVFGDTLSFFYSYTHVERVAWFHDFLLRFHTKVELIDLLDDKVIRNYLC